MNPYGAFAIYKINECQFQGGRGGVRTKPSGHTPNPLPAILNPRMIIILMAFQYIQHVTYVYLAYKFGFLGNG